MNPYQLFKEDGKPTNVHACGVCNKVKANRDAAEECCVQPPCSYCGEPVDRAKESGQRFHWVCWRDNARAREIERLEKAELVEYDGGWLYADHLPGGQDGYYSDMDELLDCVADYVPDDDEADEPLVMFAFCTYPQRHDLDLGRILENACDDGYEDMEDHLSGVKELSAAIDAFNERNKAALTSYMVDYKRKVSVPALVE